MVDVAAYDPEVVRHPAQALADVADRYVFVSTVPVYADHGSPAGRGGSRAAAGSSRPATRPTARLLAAGVDPWMGVPLGLAVPGWEGANDVDVSRALAAGLRLRLRPLAETIRDTLAWDLARGGPGPGQEGLSRDRKEDLRLLAGPDVT